MLASGGNRSIASPASTKPQISSQSSVQLLHDVPGKDDAHGKDDFLKFTITKGLGYPSEHHKIERAEKGLKRFSNRTNQSVMSTLSDDLKTTPALKYFVNGR